MYVYLKRGNVIKRFRNVILSDCYQPKVDGVAVERIEPGLWFKVLFVDSLFVDCDGRDVSWNKETCVDAEIIHKTKDDELQVETVVDFFQSKGTYVCNTLLGIRIVTIHRQTDWQTNFHQI